MDGTRQVMPDPERQKCSFSYVECVYYKVIANQSHTS